MEVSIISFQTWLGSSLELLHCVLNSRRKVCLMAVLLFVAAKLMAQGSITDGYYYIMSNGDKTSGNPHCLVPSEGTADGAPTGKPITLFYDTTTDPPMPYLTTFNTGKDQNSIWQIYYVETRVVNGRSIEFYHIVHAKDGRFLTHNVSKSTTDNRVRVHLQASSDGDNSLFCFYTGNGGTTYSILPLATSNTITQTGTNNSLNPAGGVMNSYAGVGKTATFSGKSIDVGGLIGLYNRDDVNSKWRLEPAEYSPAVCANPVIHYDESTARVSISCMSAGATIYYTTDGTDPVVGTSPTYSGLFVPDGTVTTIKAVAVAPGKNTSDIVDHALPVYAPPVITISGSTVSITPADASTTPRIYYTTDGSEPTTSSTLYSAPFTVGSGVEIVRAFAVKRGDADRSASSFYCFVYKTVSSTDEITVMEGTYHLASGFTVNGSVGTAQKPFRGIIDGGLQTIAGEHEPLVAYSDGATICNVIIDNADISGGTNVGAIVGEARGATRIYNCGVLGTGSSVSGTGYVGGIAGLLDGTSRVVNCYSYAKVSGGTDVGGIVGYNSYASQSGDIRTMVMNCMFYGTVSGGNVSPIYGGEEISNDGDHKLNNYNYFLEDNVPISSIDKPNCALAAEERFLTRFEIYRLLLNSNRELAMCYVAGNADGARTKMAKWVLDTDVAPYPILKPQGKYTSVINYDPAKAPATKEQIKTLHVTITGTGVTRSSVDLPITDMDPEHFNFNYHKVQLPYFNDVGQGNYTGNKVVTGWKITAISGGKNHFGTADYDAPNYNFADRDCTDKDLYSVSGRVFSQGAYFDVPNGVSAITIEPYWASCVYLSDTYYDSYGYRSNAGVTDFGARYQDAKFRGQTVYNDIGTALNILNNSYGRTEEASVYDYALVLVGNHHRYGTPKISNDDKKPFTLMSADLDGDNEPDFSLIYNHFNRENVAPIRFDFINVPSNVMAQKASDSGIRLVGIFKPQGWFEVTNTCLMHMWQFEYEWARETEEGTAKVKPLILLGGVYEQIVSCNQGNAHKTSYIHLGGNAWFKEFCNGTHVASTKSTDHNPISVTGGQYLKFYLTGTFRPDAAAEDDNAECYIDGGKFGEVAGAGQEQVKGNVTWLIDHAEIDNFYGGGINAGKPILGNIDVTIKNSKVGVYCGGPKFGNMSTGKTVTTNADKTEFGTFYGAGYGGSSFYRQQIADKTYRATDTPAYNTTEWQTWAANYVRGKYNDARGIAVNFEYEFFDGTQDFTVARLYVNYAQLSLAAVNDVVSNLKGCTINHNFYGGGNLGKVNGTATSSLEDCTVVGNVFGSGFSATPPTVDVMDGAIGSFSPEPYYDVETSKYAQGGLPQVTTFTWAQVGSTSNTLTEADGNHYIYTAENLSTLGQVANAVLNIKGSTTVGGNIGVLGGGEMSAVSGNVEVNIQGGTIEKDVYGGGALANTNTDSGKTTAVNLTGGTVKRNVYGGAMGDSTHQPTVGGNITVSLNKDVPDTGVKGCVVGGSIFGCNNLNGTPLGTVLVHVYKTQNAGKTKITEKEQGNYDLAAVYGGGNQAAYIPTDLTNGTTEVIVDGCALTSIQSVYGGGNAASTPATTVTVNGTFEVDEVFGGGNGKDSIDAHTPNPGANVGYYAYPDDADYATRNAAPYIYGQGKAQVNIYGGTIHAVYGGSNTKGNVRQIAVAMLEHAELCDFVVDEAYGGGKSAPMDGQARLDMKCIPGLKAAYGGARNADVNGGVTLNITNGTFRQVFGGNNEGGCIWGPITVNIEETGCRPIIIGELYGGGNRAPYSVFGYKQMTDGEATTWAVRESATDGEAVAGTPYADPQINVRSFTSIGAIYGGGYGEQAVMVGNPHVNINVVKDAATAAQQHADAQYAGQEMTIDEHKVVLPPHTAGEMGAINDVYGGGNAAKLIGDTYVKVGTEATVTFATLSGAAATKTVTGADIKGNVYGGGNAAEVTGNTNVTVGRQSE